MVEKVLKFYDLKARKSFTSGKYKLVTRGRTVFAVTTSPITGVASWRIVKRVK